MRCHIVNLRRDGEGSFTTRGTLRDGHPVPITFTSKIMSNAETSDVRMILDEGSIKELAITPPSSLDRWMASTASLTARPVDIEAVARGLRISASDTSRLFGLTSTAIFLTPVAPTSVFCLRRQLSRRCEVRSDR
jgi:hypothetical protein